MRAALLLSDEEGCLLASAPPRSRSLPFQSYGKNVPPRTARSRNIHSPSFRPDRMTATGECESASLQKQIRQLLFQHQQSESHDFAFLLVCGTTNRSS